MSEMNFCGVNNIIETIHNTVKNNYRLYSNKERKLTFAVVFSSYDKTFIENVMCNYLKSL